MRKLYRVTVHCYGIKKRCRKPDHLNFRVGEFPHEEGIANKGIFTEYIEKAYVKILTEMKQIGPDHIGRMPFVCFDVIRENTDGPYTVQTWEPFNSENLRFNLCHKFEGESNV